jgi:GT2 family glycosyltransferase
MTMSVATTLALRAEWLSWDGKRLRWRIETTQTQALLHLCIDGVVFERFNVEAKAHAQILESKFDFSPTGRSELEFSVTRDDNASVLAPWRVRFAEPAPPLSDQWSGAIETLHTLVPHTANRHDRTRAIAVIVPIFNSPQLVERCIAAVLRFSPASTRLILVDDASTDPQISVLLDACEKRPDIVVHRNAHNRGYTHSVNVGMDLAIGADVVLLNSDTEVGPRWLQSLAFAAYSDANTGTATAVSDNAGAFSVPELEQYCAIPSRWDLVATQRAILQQAGLIYPALPTGNGFCMYIKRSVIERIGVMDEQAFPQGYGEENDFCQRAEQAGFGNVIAGNVFVRHARSASFGHERRAALGVQGMAVLRTRYPNYEAQVGATLYSFKRRVLDYRVRRTYEGCDGAYESHSPRPRVLIVSDADCAEVKPLADDYESFLLCANESALQLFDYRSNGWSPIEPHSKDAETLRTWLAACGVEAVIIQEPSKIVADLARALDIPIVTQPAHLTDAFATGRTWISVDSA